MDLYSIRTRVRRRIGELEEDFWKDVEINDHINEGIMRFCHEEQWPWMYTVTTLATITAGQKDIELTDDITSNRHFNIRLTKSGVDKIFTPRRLTPGEGLRVESKYRNTNQEPRWFYVFKGIRYTRATPGGDPVTITAHRGAWDAATAYVAGDGVTHEGKTWRSKTSHSNIEPTSAATTDWTEVNQVVANVVRFVPAVETTYTPEFHYLRDPEPLYNDQDEPEIPRAYHDAIVAWAAGQCWLKELNGAGKAQEQFNIFNMVVEQAKKDLKSLATDADVAWGRQDPEFYPTIDEYQAWREIHLPQNLTGP